MKNQTIVFDFETTGHSPLQGDRPIEVGAVKIENDRIVDRFQSLMNPDFTISSTIEAITGISNELVMQALPCEEVMEAFYAFIGNAPLVAHNAAFDLSFLDAELERLGLHRENEVACSLLISRRIFQDAPNYKLKTLVEYCGIFSNDVFHRALEDAEKTGYVWIAMQDAIKKQFGVKTIPFSLMQAIEKLPKTKVAQHLQQAARKQQFSLF